ncbi:MAG: type II and III secretion system protein family protein [Desulfuromonadales bacterium]
MKRSESSSFAAAILSLIFCFAIAGQAMAQNMDRQTLELKLGGSDLVQTQHPIKRVSIADSDVADVVVLSPREIYVFGKKVGYTSVILWDDGERRKTLLDVVIGLDLTGLKEKIHELYPEQEIKVHGTETGIVLSGIVSGPEVAEQVIRLAQSFLPAQGEGRGSSGQSETGKSGSGVTNLMKVGGTQQVMLEVKFAEVRRSWGKDWQAGLAIDDIGDDKWSGAFGLGGLGVSDQGDLDVNPGSLLINFVDNAANVFVRNSDVSSALTFLESEGLSRTLAEPRLVTQSGQEASFLAGGEFPIPVPQAGAGEDTIITVEFKEFGVGLVFTPVVLSDGRISLRVQPSVSEISGISTLSGGTSSFTQLPQFVTRKLETTVQLYDGQTLALAGLLQDNIRENVSKIPLLGDLPVLGPLFRSSGYQQEKTDLLVAVTPHLVEPMQKDELRYPGEHFVPPNWFEFYLEGRLEGRPAPVRMTKDEDTLEASETEEESRLPSDSGTMRSFLDGGLEGRFGHSPSTVR